MDIVVNIKKHNGLNVVGVRDIAPQLNKDVSDVKKKVREVLENGTEYFEDVILIRGKKAKEFFLTDEGLKILLSRYSGITKEQYTALGVEGVDIRHTYTRFEVSFGDMLEEALREFGVQVIKQARFEKYRVDFYIPEKNLCVEYDESQHFSLYRQKVDSVRMNYIENKTGAKFIRCDYRESDIKNVMKVLKEVI